MFNNGLEMFAFFFFLIFMESEGQMQHLKCINNLAEEERSSNNLTFKILPYNFHALHRQCSHCQAISIYMIMIPFKLQ